MTRPEPLLDVAAASEILGVPRSWVYAAVEQDPPRLPYYRVGRYIKFRASELEMWIRARGRGNGHGRA